MDPTSTNRVRRRSEEHSRQRNPNGSKSPEPRQKDGISFPPQARKGLAKLKSMFHGSSDKDVKDFGDRGESKASSSRRSSIDLEHRHKVPLPITKDGIDPTASVSSVSPLAVDGGQPTVKILPQSQCNGSEAWLNKEQPEIPGGMVPAGDFEETITSAIANLQKPEAKAQLEVISAHAGSRRFGEDEPQLEDKFNRHELGLKQDRIDLRHEYQGAQQTRLEVREHQQSDQHALQYQWNQREKVPGKEGDVYQRLEAANEEINNWFLRYNILDSKTVQQEVQISSLRAKIDGLSEEKAALELEVVTLKSQCKKQMVSEEHLPRGRTQSTVLEQMPAELSELTIENERLRHELDRLVEQKASEVTTTDQYFYHDEYFKNEFNTLRGSIKNWANRAFSSESTTKVPRKLSEVIQKELDNTNDGWDLYLKSTDHRRSFVQAYVWGYLLRKVFGQKLWKPSRPSTSFYAKEVKKFHTSSILSTELVCLHHQHRYAAARLAVPKETEAQAIETCATQRIAQAAKDIQEALDLWTSMAKVESIKLLQGIIRQATSLDLSMNQQKASLEIMGKAEIVSKYNMSSGYSIPYDSKAMEVRFGGEPRSEREQFVELFIVPMLVKTGNADGQNFDSSIIIAKAEVDTGRLRSIRSKMSFF